MRTSTSKSWIGGLVGLSLAASVFATTEAAAAGYEYRFNPRQGQVTREYNPTTVWTHITPHYVFPHHFPSCHYGYRYFYDAYGNYVPRLQYVC